MSNVDERGAERSEEDLRADLPDSTETGLSADQGEDRTTPADPVETDDPQELRERIETTREELGETVEALSHKADLKAQLKDQVEERKEQAREAKAQVQEKISGAGEQAKQRKQPIAAGVGALLALVAVLLFLRRR